MIPSCTVVKDKGYITDLIAQGEHEHQDFKYQITDARKIARSISAFANNSGGHLLIGVKDNGHIVGVKSDEEIYMIEQAASMYCRPEQQVEFELFHVDGKTVLKADIAEACLKPVKAPDERGQWKAFYRVGDENVLASSVHVRVMQHQSQSRDDDALLSLSQIEQQLIDYLSTHGGITIDGFMRLAHVSRRNAEATVIGLCEMNVVTLTYHDGRCLITRT